MKSLSIGYITARREPRLDWFFDSLARQALPSAPIEVIVVDFLHAQRDLSKLDTHGFRLVHTSPKPTVWQGPHRLTPEDWWAVSAYRNTAACLARHEWFACIDDRSVLAPTFMKAAQRAMLLGPVAGRYEKRIDMQVDNGAISAGTVTGVDARMVAVKITPRSPPVPVPGSWFYGACNIQPLEAVFKINGWDESCDSLGLEDCVYGQMLEQNGYKVHYDPELMIIEDRTSSAVEPPLCRRTDKGISPQDKSHAILDRTRGKKRATHSFNLMTHRDLVQNGRPFPIPDGPTHDWYDGKPLAEFP